MKTLLLIALLTPLKIGMSKYSFLSLYPQATPKGMLSDTFKVVTGRDTIRVEFQGDTVKTIKRSAR